MASYNQKFKQQVPSNNYQNYSSEGEEEEDEYQYNHQGGQYNDQDDEEEDQEGGHYQNQHQQDYYQGEEDEGEEEQDQEEQEENDEQDDEEVDYRYSQKHNYEGGEEEDESYQNNAEYRQQKDYFSNQHQINEQTDEDDNEVQGGQEELDSEEEQIKQYQEFLKQQQQKQLQPTKAQTSKQAASYGNSQKNYQLEQVLEKPTSKQASLQPKQQAVRQEQSNSGKKVTAQQPKTNNFFEKENMKNKVNQQMKKYEESDEEDDEQEEQLSHKYKNQQPAQSNNPNTFSFGANKRPVSAVVKQTSKNELQSFNDPQSDNNYHFNQQSYEDQIADLKRKMQQTIDFKPNQKRLQIDNNKNHDDFNNFVKDDGDENSSDNSFDQYNSQNIGKENYLAPKMKHLQYIPRPKSSYIVSNNKTSQNTQVQQVTAKQPHPYLKKGTSTLGASRGKTASTSTFNNSKYNSNTEQDDYEQQYNDRPTTATSFKPVYKISMNEFKVKNKQFDYNNKKFKTIPKKSDPVSRYQSMQQAWKSNKFLKSNNNTSSSKSGANEREGRKLNLQERIQTSKPENMFYRYMTKNDIINQYV